MLPDAAAMVFHDREPWRISLAFSAALRGVIGPKLFAPALLWWRFYTFYIYIVLGALAAGRTAMRALRKRDELEAELERGED